MEFKGKVTILDFETTSLFEPRATEIGLVVLDDNYNEIATYETVIKPPKDISKQSLAISKLSMEQITNSGSFHEYWPDIYPFINNRVLVAHNSEFDLKVLQNELMAMGFTYENSVLCTYKMSKSINAHLKIHKLPSLAEIFSINLDAHKALNDAKATGSLLKKFSTMNPKVVETVEKHFKQLVNLPEPNWSALKPNPRKITFRDGRDTNTLEYVFEEILRSDKRDAALTGTPKIGKDVFALKCEKLGFRYNRAKPGIRYTGFLVVSDKEAGSSKIAYAEEINLPILTEKEFEEFYNFNFPGEK